MRTYKIGGVFFSGYIPLLPGGIGGVSFREALAE